MDRLNYVVARKFIMTFKNNRLISNLLLPLNIIIIFAILGWLSLILYKNFYQPGQIIKFLLSEVDQISTSKLNEKEIKKVIEFEAKRQSLKLDLSNLENRFH